MKANELMIGDWVLVHNKPQQVAIVEETCISYWAELAFSDELLTPSFAEIAPIPLTAEILEKNGWKFDEIDGTYYNKIDVYGRKAPYSIFDGIIINSVHELQHALRLCGLNELADNFKL